MTDPLQPTTSLPKGSHNQNIIVMKPTLHYSPPEKKKKEKKGGGSLTSKGTIVSNKYKYYPRRREERRKKKKRDLAIIHIPPATISSIPATKPLPPDRKEGGHRPPTALWIRSKCPTL